MYSPTGSASASGHEPSPMRRIVVAHRLPLRADPNPAARHGFDFMFDYDSLAFQLSQGLPGQVHFVGVLPAAAAASLPESDELAADLLAGYSSYAVTIPGNLPGFSDDILLPRARSTSSAHDDADQIYASYLITNTKFAERILEILNADHDILFIHDINLWPLPAMLRLGSPRARIGFYVHTTFASADLFGAMTDRERAMVLHSILNAGVVGFHMLDYAHHFVSACASLLGIESSTSRGHIVIPYNGRTVVMMILTVRVQRDQLPSPGTAGNADQVAYKGCLLAIDSWSFVMVLDHSQHIDGLAQRITSSDTRNCLRYKEL